MVRDMRYLATVVSQTFTAFGDIIGLNQRFSELSSGALRIDQVFATMKDGAKMDQFIHYADKEERSKQSRRRKKKSDGDGKPDGLTVVRSGWEDVISFDQADVNIPQTGSALATQLVLDIRKGTSLIISGHNGSGKTTLLRFLAGLWPLKRGRIIKPVPSTPGRIHPSVFFVTQKPYTTLGSLRAQLVYPRAIADCMADFADSDADADGLSDRLDQHLREILDRVRLVYLVERWGWDAEVNWMDVLSLGEQQRLGMARAFFHRPSFVALDECTNAISVDVEESLYAYAQELGITMVTITQRSGGLLAFHDQELRLLDGRGSWKHYAVKGNQWHDAHE